MRHQFFLLALFLLTGLSFGQSSTKLDRDKLIPLKWMIDTRIFDKSPWQLYQAYDKKEYAPLKGEEMSVYTTNWIQRAQTDTSWKGNRAEIPYLQNYLMSLARMFDAMTLVGPSTSMFTRGKTDSPVNFCMNGDTALTLLVRSIHLSVVYNTLKLTARQRAAQALTTYILPSLHKITDNFAAKDVPFISMSVTYGSKQALDTSPLALKAEILMVVVPTEKAKQFADGALTEDDLVAAMDIYISDRDMVAEIKRVKLVLE